MRADGYFRSSIFQPNRYVGDAAGSHLDRELTDILKGRQELIPFEERYPEIKEITYGSKK